MEDILNLSALALSVINGLILLTQWLKDKPDLRISPVHSDIYQWWFKLPDKEHENIKIRRWGFLIYVGFSNVGNKGCDINHYRLKVKNRMWPLWFWKNTMELRAVNIPQPQMSFSDHVKLYRVFGQITTHFNDDSFLEPGKSTSGMFCYLYEVWGNQIWDPKILKNGNIQTKFEIRNVFRQKNSCKILCSEKNLSDISKMLGGFNFDYSEQCLETDEQTSIAAE